MVAEFQTLSSAFINGKLNVKDDTDINGTLTVNDIGTHVKPVSTIHVESIHFENNLSSPPPYEEGMIFYDSDDKTLSLYADQEGVALQVGQEMWVRVVNKTGSDIPNGKVVYINGAQGNRPTIGLANASIEATAHRTIGVTTQEIRNNNNGYVTTFGLVRDLDLSDFIEGDVLYLSLSSGEFTDAYPDSPNHGIRIGEVISNHATEGILFVNVDAGEDLNSIHDINITSPSDGNLITYNDSLSTWINSNEITNLSASGNIETTNPSNGFVLRSPDNKRWKITVSNTGTLSAIAL